MNGTTYWYLTRGTGVVSLLLLTVGIVLGVMGPTKFRTPRLPRFSIAALHRSVTLLAFVFIVIHVLTTVLDGYAPIGLKDAVIPFIAPYRPIWLGLGAVAFDLLLALIVSSLLRQRIGLRLWRAIHWLAYASWPIALVHALGTGSDARTSWLAALAGMSVVAVVLAVIWRVVTANGAMALRISTAAAAVVMPLAIFGWYQGGPGALGWAARSGTPTTLLASTRNKTVATTTTATTTVATLPPLPFSAPLVGKIAQAGPDSNGLLSVAITGLTRGGVHAELHLNLWGQPLDGGGISMTASQVSFGPTSAPSQYTGTISSLNGQSLVASLQDASGSSLQLALNLKINANAGTLSGTLQASTGGGG